MAELAGYVAVNSIGLGHAARSIAIAEELVRRHPDLYLFFLACSPALDLAVAHGFDAMPLPPTPEWFHDRGVIHSMDRWYWEYARYLRFARKFLRKEADWTRFRFLISDGEMATIREAARRSVPTVALIHSVSQAFRGGLVARFAEAMGLPWMRSLLNRDSVCVLAVDRGVDLPNATFVGPVIRPFSKGRESLRDDFVFLKRTVLVAPGGSSAGAFLIEEAVKAWRALRLADAQMIVVSGPKIKPAEGPDIYNRGFVPHLQDYVLAADLVITLAGKGTMIEALAAGTPVIAIPLKGHPEQEGNLREFRLRYRYEDAFRLKELIPEMLSVVRPPQVDFGPTKVVDEIESFLRSRGIGLP